MNGAPRAWPVRLSAAAETDLRQILGWTSARFGEEQARAYGKTPSAALSALTAGPTIAGVRARSDIGKGMYTFHVARPVDDHRPHHLRGVAEEGLAIFDFQLPDLHEAQVGLMY